MSVRRRPAQRASALAHAEGMAVEGQVTDRYKQWGLGDLPDRHPRHGVLPDDTPATGRPGGGREVCARTHPRSIDVPPDATGTYDWTCPDCRAVVTYTVAG